MIGSTRPAGSRQGSVFFLSAEVYVSAMSPHRSMALPLDRDGTIRCTKAKSEGDRATGKDESIKDNKTFLLTILHAWEWVEERRKDGEEHDRRVDHR